MKLFEKLQQGSARWNRVQFFFVSAWLWLLIITGQWQVLLLNRLLALPTISNVAVIRDGMLNMNSARPSIY